MCLTELVDARVGILEGGLWTLGESVFFSHVSHEDGQHGGGRISKFITAFIFIRWVKLSGMSWVVVFWHLTFCEKVTSSHLADMCHFTTWMLLFSWNKEWTHSFLCHCECLSLLDLELCSIHQVCTNPGLQWGESWRLNGDANEVTGDTYRAKWIVEQFHKIKEPTF